MDIYRFINSSAIRDHIRGLQDAGCYRPFTHQEKAWLIYQCRDATMIERHAAWKELIEETTNANAEEASLRKLLNEYMMHEMVAWVKFRSGILDGKCCYDFEIKFPSGPGVDGFGGCSFLTVFSDYEKGVELLRTEFLSHNYDSIQGIICNKRPVDATTLNAGEVAGRAFLDKDFSVRRVHAYRPSSEFVELERELKNMRFEFPVPFKKGDVLCIPDKSCGAIAGPFVYDDLYDGPSYFFR